METPFLIFKLLSHMGFNIRPASCCCCCYYYFKRSTSKQACGYCWECLSTKLKSLTVVNLVMHLVEGDSLYAIQWASGQCLAPWGPANVAEEVIDLGRVLNSSLTHIKWKANEGADCVAKQGVGHLELVVQCFSDSSLIGLSV